MTPNLGILRLQWHEEASESRDARFEGWNAKKVTAWNAELESFLQNGDGNLEDIVARRWRPCPTCHRHFQPVGPRGTYNSCFSCNQVARMDGAALCVICQRTHGTAYPCCKFCETAGREDMAAFLRSLVLRRDAFACWASCGTTEGSMQIKHVDPEGSAWQWNLTTTCSSCAIVQGKTYGPLDELVKLQLMTAYATYLNCYLTPEEDAVLRVQLKETLGGDYTGPPPLDRAVLAQMIGAANLGVCDEIEGLMNCLQGFGRTGIEVTHA